MEKEKLKFKKGMIVAFKSDMDLDALAKIYEDNSGWFTYGFNYEKENQTWVGADVDRDNCRDHRPATLYERLKFNKEWSTSLFYRAMDIIEEDNSYDEVEEEELDKNIEMIEKDFDDLIDFLNDIKKDVVKREKSKFYGR